MTTVNPNTGQPLPADAIQRILFVTPKVHVYAVPPLTSNKGYVASQWTTQDAIFTARLRVLETAIPIPSSSSFTSSASNPPISNQNRSRLTTTAPTASSTSSLIPPTEHVTTHILLEDPSTGALFAAAPYTSPAAVSPCIDSSRFFAVRVVGDGDRKATLGIGFEERSDAFNFGVALQDAAKVLGVDGALGKTGSAGAGGRSQGQGKQGGGVQTSTRDYSLREGETITVKIGGKGARAHAQQGDGAGNGAPVSPALFKIQPPPADGSLPFLPPPPSAADVRAGKGGGKEHELTAEEQGFDDGEFGEFQ